MQAIDTQGRRVFTRSRHLAIWLFMAMGVFICSWLFKGGLHTAHAAGVPSANWRTRDFATDFPFDTTYRAGPLGIAFDASNSMLVSNAVNGGLYRVPKGGGTPVLLSANTVHAGLAFTKSGKFYGVKADFVNGTGAQIVELDPTNGATIRTVVTRTTCMLGLAGDPLSGDLFFSQEGGPNCPAGPAEIGRIMNPDSASPTVGSYAPGAARGLAFGRDGALYAVVGGCLKRMSGTDQPQPPTITNLACESAGEGWDGVAIATVPAAPDIPDIYINANNGNVRRILQTTSPPSPLTIVSGATRGAFMAVGGDGCIYATQTSSIVKVTLQDDTCRGFPSTPAPVVRLFDSPVPNRLVGQTQTLQMVLSNWPNQAGASITVNITGANPSTRTLIADSSGGASFSYTGTAAGYDTIEATVAGPPARTSNTISVYWATASFNVDQTVGSFGAPLTFSGSQFGAGETVSVWAEGAVSGPPLFNAVAAANGTFSANVTTPPAAGNLYGLLAIGATTGRKGRTTFQAVPKIVTSQTSGAPSSSFTVSVYGYRANELVQFGLRPTGTSCCSIGTSLTTGMTDANGTVTATITVPPVAAGSYRVLARGSTSQLTGPFQVL